MSAQDIVGTSPAPIREEAHREWLRRYVPSCGHDPRVHGVRFERQGMTCGHCDAPIFARRSA